MDVHLNSGSVKHEKYSGGVGRYTADVIVCSGDLCVPIKVIAKSADTITKHAETYITQYLETRTLDACQKKAPIEIFDDIVGLSDEPKTEHAVEKVDSVSRDEEHAADSHFIQSSEEFHIVISEPKFTLVDWTASWCGPCQSIAPLVHSLAEQHPGINVIKVDIDELRELKSEMGVRSMPTFHFYFAGEKFHTMVGARPKGLQHFVDSWKDLKEVPSEVSVQDVVKGAPNESIGYGQLAIFALLLIFVAFISFLHQIVKMLDIPHILVPLYFLLAPTELSSMWIFLCLFMTMIGVRYIPFVKDLKLPISDLIVAPFQALYRKYFPDDPENDSDTE